MSEAPSRRSTASRWKTVALPPEHGSWSLVLEPVVLGLAVAPSIPGLLTGLAAISAFLAYRPWTLWRRDAGRGRSYPRTVLARRLTLSLGGAVFLFGVAALALAGPELLVPGLCAAPVAVLYVVYDRRRGRSWQAEILAPLAVAVVAPTEALAAGWTWLPAIALWTVVVSRSVPAVLYVRERLRLERREPVRRGLAWGSHFLAVGVLSGMAASGWIPPAVLAPFVLLFVRALVGLSGFRRSASPQAVGITEIFWGVVTVIGVALGYGTGI